MLTILTLSCTRLQKNTNVQCNTYTNFLLAYYLLTQLTYARTKSPQKGLFLFHKAWNMTNDCVSVTNTLIMGVKLMIERYKKY